MQLYISIYIYNRNTTTWPGCFIVIQAAPVMLSTWLLYNIMHARTQALCIYYGLMHRESIWMLHTLSCYPIIRGRGGDKTFHRILDQRNDSQTVLTVYIYIYTIHVCILDHGLPAISERVDSWLRTTIAHPRQVQSARFHAVALTCGIPWMLSRDSRERSTVRIYSTACIWC